MARPARGRQGHPRLRHAIARKLAPEPAGRARRPRRPLCAAGHAGPHRRRRLADGAGCRHEPAATENRAVDGAARRHRPAHRARRAEHGLSQPPRLRAGAGVRRLRLEKRVPLLQRLPRVPQDRPHAALPPLRRHRARAARLPGLRQSRHRARRPRHRAARRAPGRTVRGRDAARRQRGAHRTHRCRQHPQTGRAGATAGRGAQRRSGCAGGHADDRQGPRLSPHHAGGGGEPGWRLVLQRLPRT